MKIIGFVGLPGSGKGEASRIAGQCGLTVLVMGDVIRREAARLGLAPTDQNLGSIGRDLRAAEGPDAIAKRILNLALKSGQDVVVVDGLRSLEEAEFFAGHAEQFHLVEVCAPVQARLKWLEARGRPDDPGKRDADEVPGDGKLIVSCREPDTNSRAAAQLEQRECRELGWGMCEAMKAADFKLRNDGSLEEFQENVRKLLSLLIYSSP
ncbi:MAG TPA: AAA family ATPase [Methanothrix sp.]|nr:AAA family ATPase [Methanothrix sp.]